MSYHTILKTSQDYTAALKSAREIAKNISRATGANVFPYRLIIVQVFESWTVLVFVFFFSLFVSVYLCSRSCCCFFLVCWIISYFIPAVLFFISIFYVYYEQYLTIVNDSWHNLLYCLGMWTKYFW